MGWLSAIDRTHSSLLFAQFSKTGSHPEAAARLTSAHSGLGGNSHFMALSEGLAIG